MLDGAPPLSTPCDAVGIDTLSDVFIGLFLVTRPRRRTGFFDGDSCEPCCICTLRASESSVGCENSSDRVACTVAVGTGPEPSASALATPNNRSAGLTEDGKSLSGKR